MYKLIIVFHQLILFVFFLGCGIGKEIIEISFNCDNNSNDGNAVVLTIYQLTNSENFRFLTYEDLAKSPEKTLGTDLIANSKYERIMVPGERFILNEFEIKNEAAFIGVLADFHSPSGDGWQQLVKLSSNLDRLIIYVHENSISVQVDD
jgi:type VI secretion system VasD/TssJ family lipoprotein